MGRKSQGKKITSATGLGRTLFNKGRKNAREKRAYMFANAQVRVSSASTHT
jgi:hypothetical protein